MSRISILTPRNRQVYLQLQAFDAAYLEALRSADAETTHHFVTYFTQLIHIKLWSGYRSRQLSDDICQETFARVFRIVRSPEGVRHPERLGALVNSVCNNVLLESLRACDRHPQIDEQFAPPARASTPDPEQCLISKERSEQIQLVIAELPERDRRILRALFFEEQDKDEVCAEMGVGRDYLRVLVHRAKALLRNRMLGRPTSKGARPGGQPAANQKSGS